MIYWSVKYMKVTLETAALEASKNPAHSVFFFVTQQLHNSELRSPVSTIYVRFRNMAQIFFRNSSVSWLGLLWTLEFMWVLVMLLSPTFQDMHTNSSTSQCNCSKCHDCWISNTPIIATLDMKQNHKLSYTHLIDKFTADVKTMANILKQNLDLKSPNVDGEDILDQNSDVHFFFFF